MTRVCSQCKLEKPLENFTTDKRKKFGRAYRCKSCAHIYAKIYRHKNPDKIKKWRDNWNTAHPESQKSWEKHKSRSEFYQQLEKQGGVCAICKLPETRLTIEGNFFLMAWDHDHQTGKMRALLCNRCNLVLGKVSDDPQLLQRMARYIEEWKENHYPNGDLI